MITSIDTARKIRSMFSTPVAARIEDSQRAEGDEVVTVYRVSLVIRDAATGNTVAREIRDDVAIDSAKITAEMVAELKRRSAATRKLMHAERGMGR